MNAYKINLSGIVKYICPKVHGDPELQSNEVIYCISEVTENGHMVTRDCFIQFYQS